MLAELGVARGRTLLVFCTLVEQADGPPGLRLPGRRDGDRHATSCPSLTFTASTSLPFAEPAGVSWGTGAVRVDGTVYVYGAAAGARSSPRVAFDRLTTGPWHLLDRALVGSTRRPSAR